MEQAPGSPGEEEQDKGVGLFHDAIKLGMAVYDSLLEHLSD